MTDNTFEIKVLEKTISATARVIRRLDGLTERMKKFNARLRFIKYELLFGERDEDVYIVSFLKSGTTWMQQILYQMTTQGDMGFKHIYEVSPWLRNLSFTSSPLPELPSPRLIKSHDPYHLMRKGKRGRFIFLLRNGIDVANSLYHHRKDYNDNKITFDKSFDISFNQSGHENWFEFNREWLLNRNKHSILYVRYEDLKTKFDHEINRIAGFLSVTLTPEAILRIKERTSFDFMKQNETKFGEQPLPDKHVIIYNNFIRKGEVGGGIDLINKEQLKIYSDNLTIKLGRFKEMKPYMEQLSLLKDNHEQEHILHKQV